jgi:hypothetical protein
MKDFMMIFRSPVMGDFKPSAEQMQASIKKWQDWIGGIAAQGKFGSTNALGYEGKILKAGNTVVDGPYTELKEMVGGYLIVKEKSLDNAIKLAEGCPVLEMGGHVEVRDIMVINPN